MSNVFQLFEQRKIEKLSDPKTIVTVAVAKILASTVELARTVKELSKHLDALDHAIDAISDTDTRNQLKQVVKPESERLTDAMLELSREIRKLPAAQRELSEAAAYISCVKNQN
jgi:predicted ribosome quality control (RQC) complex YloA/Tae2 family protein